MSLRGKVYAVTGGASGIGLATAKIISERGGTVCIADVNQDALNAAESYFGSKTPCVPYRVTQVDVSNKQQVIDWIAGIKNTFHRLDGAANIAGVIGRDHGIKAVAELDDDEWDTIIGVNLTGMMYCLRAELKNIADGGSIVNMASIHATTGGLVITKEKVLNGCLTIARRCKSWCLRCKQTWRFRPNSGRCQGEWPSRGPS